MKKAKAMTVSSAPKHATGAKAHTLQWAAQQLGVTLPAVYKLIRDRKLRTFHVGTAHRVSDDALRECIRHLEAEELI
jgi:excisionase family DNA binding protein